MHVHYLTPELHYTRNGAKGKKGDFVLFITFEWLLNLMITCLVRASQEMTEIDTTVVERKEWVCCSIARAPSGGKTFLSSNLSLPRLGSSNFLIKQ